MLPDEDVAGSLTGSYFSAHAFAVAVFLCGTSVVVDLDMLLGRFGAWKHTILSLVVDKKNRFVRESTVYFIHARFRRDVREGNRGFRRPVLVRVLVAE